MEDHNIADTVIDKIERVLGWNKYLTRTIGIIGFCLWLTCCVYIYKIPKEKKEETAKEYRQRLDVEVLELQKEYYEEKLKRRKG